MLEVTWQGEPALPNSVLPFPSSQGHMAHFGSPTHFGVRHHSRSIRRLRIFPLVPRNMTCLGTRHLLDQLIGRCFVPALRCPLCAALAHA